MNVLDIVLAELTETMLSTGQINNRIEEVGQSIKNYCNRNDIPEGLKYVHANMVIDLISLKEKERSDAVATKSVKEGDTQVVFEALQATSSESATQKVLYNYTSQLNKYRKLRW